MQTRFHHRLKTTDVENNVRCCLKMKQESLGIQKRSVCVYIYIYIYIYIYTHIYIYIFSRLISTSVVS